MIDAERGFVEELIELQFLAQRDGYGRQFPNAFYFIVEYRNEPVGRAAVDFGQNEVRLMDIAFMPAARNRGYGESVIRALQIAAKKVAAPLTLSVLTSNHGAFRLYENLGFRVEERSQTHALMAWYPRP